jgi:hypothetical protein
MAPSPGRGPAAGQVHPRWGQHKPGAALRGAAPRRARPGRAARGEPGPPGLVDLEELAGELNRLRCPALALAPRGEPPHVDVSPPGSMTAGQRIYLRDGMFVWPAGQPAGPVGHPAVAARVIAAALAASGGPQS